MRPESWEKAMDDSPFFRLLQKGHTENIIQFLQGTPEAAKNERHALHHYLGHGLKSDCRVVEYLIKYGAPINDVDHWGRTPAHFGVERSVAITNILIESGANLEIRDNDGIAPLDQCLGNGIGVMALVLDKLSSSPNFHNHLDTALEFGAKNGHLPEVVLLLTRGANPFCVDVDEIVPKGKLRVPEPYYIGVKHTISSWQEYVNCKGTQHSYRPNNPEGVASDSPG